MINTESELREAIAWFREIGARDTILSDRVVWFDGWWICGGPLYYIAAHHNMFARNGGYHDFEVAPWLVARLQKGNK